MGDQINKRSCSLCFKSLKLKVFKLSLVMDKICSNNDQNDISASFFIIMQKSQKKNPTPPMLSKGCVCGGGGEIKQLVFFISIQNSQKKRPYSTNDA